MRQVRVHDKAQGDANLEIVPTFVTQLDGKILPNAHAIGDVDGDDATELIFGSITGDIAIYKIKADRFVKWRSCTVDGSVTSICIDTSSANDARVFVATAEGSCFVVTESGDEFRVSSEFRVSLNVCDLAVLDGDLVVGTRDGGLYIYRADSNAVRCCYPLSPCINGHWLGGYKQLEKFEIKREIESFQLLNANGNSQLVVRCISGEFFQVATLGSEEQKKMTVLSWKEHLPTAGFDDEVAYIVDGVRSSSEGGDDEQSVAVASLSGKIAVFNEARERQWGTKLSEAVVALDKLSIVSPSSGKTHDARFTPSLTDDIVKMQLVACTWSGRIFVVENPDLAVHFRILYPASYLFCADVFENADKCERFLVAISTSGVIFVFRGLEDTLSRALARSSLSWYPIYVLINQADTIRQSELFAQIDSTEKRQQVMAKLAQNKSIQADDSPLLADLLASKTKKDEGEDDCPTIEDIVRLAVSTTSI